MIKYIVFDVDRTLVDSFGPELESFQEAIENVMGFKINAEQARSFTIMPTSVFFKYLKLNDDQIQKILHEWDITYKKYKISCFSGIKETIYKLSQQGYILGLITSRTIDEYQELDEVLNDIKELFKIIVTSDKINNEKPNSESMDYLCNQLKCKSEEVLYIGDSLIDKKFATNSNCYFIPVCYDNKELIKEENACFDPKDIPDIIEKIRNK